MAEFLDDGASTSGPANKHAIYQPHEATMPDDRESPRPRQHDVLATMLKPRANRVSWHPGPWNVDLAAVVTVLVLTCWIAYSDRHAASFLGSFELQRTIANVEQVPLPPAQAVSAEDGSKFPTVSIPVGEARTAAFLQRVELAENEVVHIGEDVTVRYFTPRPALHRVPVGQNQVVHMGEDVTVRYFTPQPAPHRVPAGQYQVVHMGEDVTVRYFTPVGRNTRD
jgi:hypothetical protein